MRISALGQLFNPEIRKADGAKKAEQAKQRPLSTDRTELSSNAQRLSDTKAQVDLITAQISSQPDVRPEKVAEIKQKISDGYYNTPEFVDKLAEKLAQEFGVKKP
jgi:flagellar biosynthesis anti-sigma factor FlgM